jgi:uncharacterized delta-60 repeat protein
MEPLEQRQLLAAIRDVTFDSDGIVANSTLDNVVDVALLPDNSVIAADGGALMKFSANGALDVAFGAGGRLATPAMAVEVDSNGLIVAAGIETNAATGRREIVTKRFNAATGALDIAFATPDFGADVLGGGISYGTSKYTWKQREMMGPKEEMEHLDQGDTPDRKLGLAVQTDGDIVVAASIGGDVAIVRFDSNGTLDGGFNGTGLVRTSSAVFGSTVVVNDVAIWTDPGTNELKPVVAGTINTGASADMFVARYRANGSLDDSAAGGNTQFTASGFRTLDFAGTEDVAEALTIDANGRILIVGSTAQNAHDFAATRILGTGADDAGFAGAGRYTKSFAGHDFAHDIAINPSTSNITIVGERPSGEYNYNWAMIELDPSGKELDVTPNAYDSEGGDPPKDDRAWAVAIGGNGRIVIGGFNDPAFEHRYPLIGGETHNTRNFEGDGQIGRFESSADTDGDGLPDEWEINGIDSNDDGTVDLRIPNCDYRFKDLYVEVDYMTEDWDQNGVLNGGETDVDGSGGVTDRRPRPFNVPAVVAAGFGLATGTSLDLVVQSFLNSPVSNPPDALGNPQPNGIRLHVLIDEAIDFVQNWPGDDMDEFATIKNNRNPGTRGGFGTVGERQTQPNPASPNPLLDAKKLVYRYAIFANQYDGGFSGGLGEVNGDDFFVAAWGSWGTAQDQAAYFMHEFGHNLALDHGGHYQLVGGTDKNGEINFKQNYHSLMNYLWSTPNGAAVGYVLDYSRQAAPTLDEAAISEAAGLNPFAPPANRVQIGPLPVAVPAGGFGAPTLVNEGGSVILNGDGDTTDLVALNINDLDETDADGDGSRDKVSPANEVLLGHNDWTDARYPLAYGIGKGGNYADSVSEGDHIELTEGQRNELFDILSYTAPVGNGTDKIAVRRNGADLEIFDETAGIVVACRPLNATRAIHLNGAECEDDIFTLDFSYGGYFAVQMGVRVDGARGGNDEFILRGGEEVHVGSYIPDSANPGYGIIYSDGMPIALGGLEPVTISGVLNFTFTTPNSDDVLTIDSPATGWNRISGTSGGVGLESMTFYDITNLTIDAAANDGASPNDSISIVAPGIVASGLQNLTIRTGSGDDTLMIASDQLSLPLGNVKMLFDAGVGTDSINVVGDADYLLTDVSLTNSRGGAIRLSGVDRATLSGGPSDNRLDASGFTAGPVTLIGGAGDDLLIGSPNGDDMRGSDGDDVFVGNGGIDTVTGGAGTDTVLVPGTVGADTLAVAEAAGTHTVTINAQVTTYAATSTFERILVEAGERNDSVTLSGALVATTVDAGAGNDTVDASAATTAVILLGGAGDDSLTGGAGDDRLEGGDGMDNLVGNAGNDTILGGSSPDTINGGAGSDRIDGGDDPDVYVFAGEGAADDDGITVSAVGASVTVANASTAGVFQWDTLSDIEQLDINTGDSLGTNPISDQVTVNPLQGTEIEVLNVDGGSDGNNRLVLIGSEAADTITVGRLDSNSNIEQITGLGPVITTPNFLGSSGDTLEVHGRGGDDVIKADDTALTGEPNLIFDGDEGNDFLSADATLNGGAGDDTLVGGAGADTLNGGAGEDTMIGLGGNDTFDGGEGFDTILIPGTSGADAIDVFQSSATSLVHTVNGDTQTDTLVSGTVEQARIEAGAGADTIRVRTGDALFDDPGLSLRITVLGGLDSVQDRLAIIDDGTDDLTIYRKAQDDSAGSAEIGPGNAEPFVVVFEQIERLQFLDETGVAANTAGTGSRMMVFKHDPFENNDDQTIATYLGAGALINVDPTIDPGATADPFGGGTPLAGDEDWYQFVATETGVMDFHVYFQTLDKLASGRPGLPGAGDLTIEIYDSDGLPAASNPTATGTALTDPAGNVVGKQVDVPVIRNQIYYLRVLGATPAAINQYNFTAINLAAPVASVVDLTAATDSGRNNSDNITNFDAVVNPAAEFDIVLDDDRVDEFANLNLAPDATDDDAPDAAADYGLEVFNNGVSIGYAWYVAGNTWHFTATAGDLNEGSNNFISAAVWVRDQSDPQTLGRGELSPALQVTLDTIAPSAPSISLDPASDTGVVGNPETFTDGVTSNTHPEFFGTAEADAVVRLYANDTAVGLTVSKPYDGNEAFPEGHWRAATEADLNDPTLFPKDGSRQIAATAEDVAGNVSEPSDLSKLIFIDTAGPQVTDVYVSGRPDYNLFGTRPENALQGPTPAVWSLMINVQDLPGRDAWNFLDHVALKYDVAMAAGNYRLVGDALGIVPISSVVVTNDPLVDGKPATATIELRFASPLADDRYTLTVCDTLVDRAGNRLDGESNAAEPQGGPTFPSGDGQPGGNFVARFNVDTRSEIGVWHAQSAYVDLNGNWLFDPDSGDAANRDAVYKFGKVGDKIFVGNFTYPAGGKADGFSKLAAYSRAGKYARWLVDTDNDGVWDLRVLDPTKYSGTPVAGNFDGNAANGDEVGLFSSGKWYVDTNHDFKIDTTIKTKLSGQPVVGDFDGDGKDDLGAWKTNAFNFDLARNGWGKNDAKVALGFKTTGSEKAVAADMDGDGIDDVGVWVPYRKGADPQRTGEFYILVSNDPTGAKRVLGTVKTLNHAFSPTPAGKDVYAKWGTLCETPLLGNFAGGYFDPTGDGPEGIPVPTINVLGTPDNDTFAFGPGDGSWVATLNGVSEEIPSASVRVTFDGMAGTDSVQVTGTVGGNIAELYPNRGTITGPGLSGEGSGYRVAATNVESIAVDATGAGNVACLFDSRGDDLLIAAPLEAALSGTGFTLEVNGFDTVRAYASAGGHDIAHLTGSLGRDKLNADKNSVRLYGEGYQNRAQCFEEIYAHGLDDKDLAVIVEGCLQRGAEVNKPLPSQVKQVLSLDKFEQVQWQRKKGGNKTICAADEIFRAYWF